MESFIGFIICIALIVFAVNRSKKKKAQSSKQTQQAPAKTPNRATSSLKKPAATTSGSPLDYMHIFRVAGVTFKNGRRSRQTILRQIHFHDAPYENDPEIRLNLTSFDGKPAVEVLANDEQIGNISKADLPLILPLLDKIRHIEPEVTGGGTNKDGEQITYGMKLLITFTVPVR